MLKTLILMLDQRLRVLPLILLRYRCNSPSELGIVEVGLEVKILAVLCCSGGAAVLESAWVGFVFGIWRSVPNWRWFTSLALLHTEASNLVSGVCD